MLLSVSWWDFFCYRILCCQRIKITEARKLQTRVYEWVWLE